MDMTKKVLHLVSADCEWEAAAHIIALAAALRDQGWQSVVTAPDHSRLDEFAEAAGVEAMRYALTKTINPLGWKELSDLVKDDEIAVLHIHDTDAAQMVSRANWFSSRKGMVVARRELQTSIASAEYGSSVEAILCPSKLVEEAYKKLGKPGEKTVLLYDGVNLSVSARAAEDRQDIKASYRDSYCPDKEKPLFLVYIAPLEKSSNHQALLEALPEVLAVLPQTHLFLMGEGSERPELERQIRIMALENDIEILDPDRAYARLQAAADIYLSLRNDDVSGFMPQSAMAAGRATALLSEGCYPELVEHEKNGILIPEANPVAIKEAVLGLLENRSHREHIGRMGQAYANKHFSILEHAATVAEIYGRIVERSRE